MRRVLRAVLVLAIVVAASNRSLSAQQPSSADAERVKQRFVGSFKLTSWTQYDAAGQASKSPYTLGQISYDAAGRMSAQLMTEERQAMAAARGRGQAQGADPFNGYIAYYGRFEVDPAKGTVTHYVEGSTNLGMIGTPQVRYFELTPDGRTLFLSTKTGDRVTGRLQWDRF